MDTTFPLHTYNLFEFHDNCQYRENVEQEQKTDAERNTQIFCVICDQIITATDQQIVKGGNHIHTFRNPTGVSFTIGCYKNTPGCRDVGEASTEWSWFDGYSWTICVCMKCSTHLGWSFEDDAKGCFYGLILDRLAEKQS